MDERTQAIRGFLNPCINDPGQCQGDTKPQGYQVRQPGRLPVSPSDVPQPTPTPLPIVTNPINGIINYATSLFSSIPWYVWVGGIGLIVYLVWSSSSSKSKKGLF